ncbi:hypothetical protein Btru_024055 [Bulinus truncatus]|nr:hypothetical protein Btru_024055 [Bulinus truncatus]
MAVKDNVKLNNLVRHHKCIVKVKTDEIENLRQELLQVKVDSRLETTLETVNSMDKTIINLNLRIQNIEKQKSELTEELAKQSSRTKEAVESMTQAHKLILKHLANAEERRNEVTSLFLQCNELRAQNTQLSLELRQVERKLETETRVYANAQQRWKDRESQLQEALTSVTDKLNVYEKEKQLLEEANFIYARKVEELSDHLSGIQVQLNVDKENFSQQTGTSYICLCDASLQISPNMTTNMTQTSQLVQFDRESQTYFRMPSVYIQTEYPSVASSSCQTHLAAIMYDTDFGLLETDISRGSPDKEVQEKNTYQPNNALSTIQAVPGVDAKLTKTIPIPWSHVRPFSISKTDADLHSSESQVSNLMNPFSQFKQRNRHSVCQHKSKSHLPYDRKNLSSESLKNVEICKTFDEVNDVLGPQYLSENVTFHPVGQKRQKVLNTGIYSTGGHPSYISLLNLFIHSKPSGRDDTQKINSKDKFKGIIKDMTRSKLLRNINKKSVKFPEQIETVCQGLTPQSKCDVNLPVKDKLERKVFLKSIPSERKDETGRTSPTDTAQSPLLFTATVLDDSYQKFFDDDLKDDTVTDSWSSDMTSKDIIHLH